MTIDEHFAQIRKGVDNGNAWHAVTALRDALREKADQLGLANADPEDSELVEAIHELNTLLGDCI